MTGDMKDMFNQMAPPFTKMIGMTVTSAMKEKLTAEILVAEDHATAMPVMHGGAIMAFADSMGAMGTFMNMPQGAMTTTIESKTNFMGAIPVGEMAYAEATPLHIGKSTQVWQTRITRQNGKLAAIVTQTQMVKVF